MTETEMYRKQLAARTERLAALVGLDAPLPVIAVAITLVTRAMYALAPDEMGSAEGRWQRESVRRQHCLCIFCGNDRLANGSGDMCEACIAEATP